MDPSAALFPKVTFTPSSYQVMRQVLPSHFEIVMKKLSSSAKLKIKVLKNSEIPVSAETQRLLDEIHDAETMFLFCFFKRPRKKRNDHRKELGDEATPTSKPAETKVSPHRTPDQRSLLLTEFPSNFDLLVLISWMLKCRGASLTSDLSSLPPIKKTTCFFETPCAIEQPTSPSTLHFACFESMPSFGEKGKRSTLDTI